LAVAVQVLEPAFQIHPVLKAAHLFLAALQARVAAAAPAIHLDLLILTVVVGVVLLIVSLQDKLHLDKVTQVVLNKQVVMQEVAAVALDLPVRQVLVRLARLPQVLVVVA
jgi:hypothetical protein